MASSQVIELNTSNLYAGGRIIEFDNGERMLLREKLSLDYFSEIHYHIVQEEQELTTIADKYWRSTVKNASRYWWVLADVNDIFNPLDIASLLGRQIAIPQIKELKKLR